MVRLIFNFMLLFLLLSCIYDIYDIDTPFSGYVNVKSDAFKLVQTNTYPFFLRHQPQVFCLFPATIRYYPDVTWILLSLTGFIRTIFSVRAILVLALVTLPENRRHRYENQVRIKREKTAKLARNFAL